MTNRHGQDMDDERGQVTVLIVGLTVVVVMLVAVVVDASRVFLYQRALAGAADGAAVAAAQSVDLAAVYTRGPGEQLPLDPAQARAAVAAYADDADLGSRFSELRIVRVAVTDDVVTVTLSAVVDLPLSAPGAARDYPLTATASARSPVG